MSTPSDFDNSLYKGFCLWRLKYLLQFWQIAHSKEDEYNSSLLFVIFAHMDMDSASEVWLTVEISAKKSGKT